MYGAASVLVVAVAQCIGHNLFQASKWILVESYSLANTITEVIEMFAMCSHEIHAANDLAMDTAVNVFNQRLTTFAPNVNSRALNISADQFGSGVITEEQYTTSGQPSIDQHASIFQERTVSHGRWKVSALLGSKKFTEDLNGRTVKFRARCFFI